MAQRRPISSHPAFAPLIALWFAALFGLAVAVLPAPLLERALSASGLDALVPLTAAGRVVASGAAALAGALLGLLLAALLARRARRDPRPIYEDVAIPLDEIAIEQPARRPLRVREELGEGPGEADEPATMPGFTDSPSETGGESRIAEAEEGFMILTPQPVHPPRPAADIEGLLAQFDNALAAFRAEEEQPGPARVAGRHDPVHAFVARQTGAPVPGAAPSPLGGPMPDHQAELRAALDKLARAHRKD